MMPSPSLEASSRSSVVFTRDSYWPLF